MGNVGGGGSSRQLSDGGGEKDVDLNTGEHLQHDLFLLIIMLSRVVPIPLQGICNHVELGICGVVAEEIVETRCVSPGAVFRQYTSCTAEPSAWSRRSTRELKAPSNREIQLIIKYVHIDSKAYRSVVFVAQSRRIFW